MSSAYSSDTLHLQESNRRWQQSSCEANVLLAIRCKLLQSLFGMSEAYSRTAIEDEGGILFQSQAEEAVSHIQPLLASDRISLFTDGKNEKNRSIQEEDKQKLTGKKQDTEPNKQESQPTTSLQCFEEEEAQESLHESALSDSTDTDSDIHDLLISPKAACIIHDFTKRIVSSLLQGCTQLSVLRKKEHITASEVQKALRVLMSATPASISPDIVLSNTEVVVQYFGQIEKAIQEFMEALGDSNWIYAGRKSDVDCYHQMVDEQGAYCTMGIGVIPCTPHAIRDALLDMNIAHHIDELLEEGAELQCIDSHTKILHLKFAATTCFLKWYRDVVILVHWFERSDGSLCIVGRSLEDDDQYPPPTGYLRAHIYSSGYLLEPQNNGTKMTYVSRGNLTIEAMPTFIYSRFRSMIYTRQPLLVADIRRYLQEHSGVVDKQDDSTREGNELISGELPPVQVG